MNRHQLRSTVGLFLVLAQFALMGAILWLGLTDRLTFDDATTAIALVLPLFAVHTTTIVKYFVEHAERQPNSSAGRLSAAYALLSFIIPVIFVAYFFALVAIRASGGLPKFENFKTALGIGETAFGLYVGLIVGSLFRVQEP
jgi:hypothetical protein